MLKRKDLLGLKDLSIEEIDIILQNSDEFKKMLEQNVKKTPHLSGKSITTLFYENSTRTRMSFETAAKFMSANTSSIAVSTSSVQKGETLIDTGKTLDALLTDVIIIRHSHSGAAHLLAKNVKASVINGGDGTNEHPTQALLDMYTMRQHFGFIKGLKVVIVGDIKHSRVARSNIWGLTKMGANVTVVAPNTLMPLEVSKMGCKVSNDLVSSADGADVIMSLRLQQERMSGSLLPSVAEYHSLYGINDKIISLASKNAIIMHPGPMNRGVEITSAVADSSSSLITAQVTNGVAVRMAVLFLLTRQRA